jgi:hypothetical protein
MIRLFVTYLIKNFYYNFNFNFKMDKHITADYEHRSDLADGMIAGSVEGMNEQYDQHYVAGEAEILVMD